MKTMVSGLSYPYDYEREDCYFLAHVWDYPVSIPHIQDAPSEADTSDVSDTPEIVFRPGYVTHSKRRKSSFLVRCRQSYPYDWMRCAREARIQRLNYWKAFDGHRIRSEKTK